MAQPSDQAKAAKHRGMLPLPSASEFLTPRWFFGFLKAFIGSWFVSRQLKTIILAVPAILFFVAGSVMAWRLAEPPGIVLAAIYESAAVKASRLESYAESDLLWERLMQLRPEDEEVRFRLARDLVAREQFAAAAPPLEILTGENGYPPACLWLVKQSREESPGFPLTPRQKIAQLQVVVKSYAGDVQSHRLLTEIYIEQQNYRVAEQHLLQVVNLHPTLGLLLYELQIQLQRSDNAKSLGYLQKAATAYAAIFGDGMPEAPDYVQTIIAYSKTLLYLNKTAEAEKVLEEALRSINSPALRATMAELMIRHVAELIKRSPLNAPIAAKFVVKAAEFQPENPQLASLCVELAPSGSQFLKRRSGSGYNTLAKTAGIKRGRSAHPRHSGTTPGNAAPKRGRRGAARTIQE